MSEAIQRTDVETGAGTAVDQAPARNQILQRVGRWGVAGVATVASAITIVAQLPQVPAGMGYLAAVVGSLGVVVENVAGGVIGVLVPLGLVLIILGLLAGIAIPAAAVPGDAAKRREVRGTVTIGAVILAILTTAVANLPAPTRGELSLEILEARVPMTFVTPSGRLPAVGFVVALQNRGSAAVRLDSLLVRSQPGSSEEILFGNCPRSPSGSMSIMVAGATQTDSVALVIPSSRLLADQVGSDISADTLVEMLVTCSLGNPGLIPALVSANTRHVIQIVDGNGRSIAATLVWPAMAIPPRLAGTRFEALADSTVLLP